MAEKSRPNPSPSLSPSPQLTTPVDAPEGVCTGPYQPAPSTELPLQAGSYRIESELGHGGMGEVFRVHDPEFDRALAVKVLLAQHAGQPELERRFLEEAHITGRLQHPGIAPVHAIG